MAITKVKLKQLENSATIGSIPSTDSSNILTYVAPLTQNHLWGYEHGTTATLPILIGTNLSYDAGTNTLNASAGAGGYADVLNDGSGFTNSNTNTKLNFVGSALQAADGGAGETDITIATILNTIATDGAVDLTDSVTGDLPFANLAQIAGLSVLGVTGNSTADVAAITAGTDNMVLRRSGTSLAFGAVNLASSDAVTGVLDETNGGTGQSTITTGDILQGTASNTLGKLASVATGNALISGGVATANSWGKIGLTTHVSGTLPVGNGGTGATTLTGLLQGNGTSAITAITNSSTVGQVLRVTGASTYAWGALDLADTDAVTGVLDEVNGGTGNSSYTAGDMLYATGSNTLGKRAIGTNGHFMRVSGGLPTWGTAASTDLSDTANIALLNANQTFTGNNTFSNNITMSGTPSASTDVVTVGYINNALANGIKYHSVRGATTAALTITGRTATTLTVGGTSLVVDGVTYANGEEILVKNDATGSGGSSADNGAYVVSGVGSSILLTRSSYMNTAGNIDAQTFVIEDGTANVGTIWITTSEVTTLGTDAIVFTQIQTSGSVTGTGANNQISVWSGTSTQDGDSTFTWDQTQMTVGTATPATSARVTIQGTGTSSSTFGLVLKNSSTTDIFKFQDNSVLVADTGSSSASFGPTGISKIDSNTFTISGSATTATSLYLRPGASGAVSIAQTGGATAGNATLIVDGITKNATSTSQSLMRLVGTYSPNGAGTSTFDALQITNTINQTTHTGISTGIRIEPTLTAAADYKAIYVTTNSSHYSFHSTAGKIRFDLGSDATGDLITRESSGEMVRIAAGTSGYVLTSNGAGTKPTWQAAASATAVTRAYLTGSTTDTIDLDSGTAVTDIDGSNVSFTTSGLSTDQIFVVRNGVTLSQTGTVSRDYTLNTSTGVLVLASALSTDETLMVYKVV